MFTFIAHDSKLANFSFRCFGQSFGNQFNSILTWCLRLVVVVSLFSSTGVIKWGTHFVGIKPYTSRVILKGPISRK